MSKKYNYPELERVDTEIGRYYKDSNQNLVPSVTTVLSNTSDKSLLLNKKAAVKAIKEKIISEIKDASASGAPW